MAKTTKEEAIEKLKNDPVKAYQWVIDGLEEMINIVSICHQKAKSSNETIEELRRDLINSLVIAKGKYNSAIKFFNVIKGTKFMIYSEDGSLVQAPLEKVLKSVQSISEITKETKI